MSAQQRQLDCGCNQLEMQMVKPWLQLNNFCEAVKYKGSLIILFTGCEFVPTGYKGRMVFIAYWAMCVVLYASFTARLTTQLTTPNPVVVNSIEQALQEDYRISVIRGSQQHLTFAEVASS